MENDDKDTLGEKPEDEDEDEESESKPEEKKDEPHYSSVEEVLQDSIGDEKEAEDKYEAGIAFVEQSNDPNKDKILAVLKKNHDEEKGHEQALDSLLNGGDDEKGEDSDDEKKAMGLMGF